MIILKTLLGIVMLVIFILLIVGWCYIWEWLKTKFLNIRIFKKWNESKIKSYCNNCLLVILAICIIISVIITCYYIGEIIL